MQQIGVKRYKNIQDWTMGKVINIELCNKYEFEPRTNGICTDQNPSRRMTRMKFSGILS